MAQKRRKCGWSGAARTQTSADRNSRRRRKYSQDAPASFPPVRHNRPLATMFPDSFCGRCAVPSQRTWNEEGRDDCCGCDDGGCCCCCCDGGGGTAVVAPAL